VAPGLKAFSGKAFGGLITSDVTAAGSSENLKFWLHNSKFWYNLSISAIQPSVYPNEQP
jgi:hypothetical protein